MYITLKKFYAHYQKISMIEVFFAFALLASAISTNKIILATLSPIFFVGIRMLIAGTILFAIAYAKGQSFNKLSIRRDALTLLFITICTTYLPSILKAYALKYMPSSKAAFFGTLDPFVTAFYTYMLFNEKLTLRKIIGMSLGCIGAFILLRSTTFTQESWPTIFIFSFPEIAALLAVILGRYGWISIQLLLRQNKYTPLQINAITMFGSGVISLITSWFIDTDWNFQFPVTSWLLLFAVYTIIIGNVIALTLYATFLKYYSSIFLSLASFSVPLFVHFYGWVYLGEPLSFIFFLSLIFTFLGLYIFYSDKREQIINH